MIKIGEIMELDSNFVYVEWKSPEEIAEDVQDISISEFLGPVAPSRGAKVKMETFKDNNGNKGRRVCLINN